VQVGLIVAPYNGQIFVVEFAISNARLFDGDYFREGVHDPLRVDDDLVFEAVVLKILNRAQIVEKLNGL
jgi:hypothetical protein